VSFVSDQQHQKKSRAGRVTIRMPTSLHEELAQAAEADGVSLNQFVCALLASGMQWRHGADERDAGNATARQGKRGTTNEEYERIWRNTFG
jgi:HicB family